MNKSDKIFEIVSNSEEVKSRLIFKYICKEPDNYTICDRLILPVPNTKILMGFDVDCNDIFNEPNMNTSIPVMRNHLEFWGFSIEDVEKYAVINTPKRKKVVIKFTDSFLGIFAEEKLPMVIVTNEQLCNGAVAITYEGVSNIVHDILNDDFYVLPASIHETICVPKNLSEKESLLEMVIDINNSPVLRKNDILTDDVLEIVDGQLSSAFR